MNLVKKLFIANIIVLFFVLAFIVYTAIKFNSFLSIPASNVHKGLYIEVQKQEPVQKLIKTLKNKGLITRSDWFYYYLRLSGEARNIKAGYHFFYTDYTPEQVLDELVSPKIYTVKVTILPEFSLKRIINILKSKGLNSEGFEKIAYDPNFVEKCVGYKAKNLEGFLYPDTYFIAKSENPKNIAKLMCKRFKEVFNEIKKSDNFTSNDYKKLIIASIIQKEATDERDMKLVASVIYNRLKKNMFLQMDSTRTLDNKSFDTYLHKGLPPQPICNPAKEAIEAAYNPINSDFLYFISKKDGKMIFSKTLKEHNRNIRKYLK